MCKFCFFLKFYIDLFIEFCIFNIPLASSTCSPTCRERAMEIKAVSPGPHRPASPSLFPSTEIYNVDPLDDHSAFPKISSNGDGMQQLLVGISFFH
jgi:hypothetical protein